MMTNNISLSEESEVNALEITQFNVDGDYDPDDDENEELNIINLENKNKQKNYKIKLISFLLCLLILLLLLVLFAGGILQKSFGFLGSNNGDESNGINIMDEIHIRSQLMRELRGNRTNEQECEARRCCDIRDGLTINQLPKGLNCSLLTDDECGDMDEFCEWDCDSPIHKSRKKGKFIKHFRKISGFPTPYQPPQIINNSYNGSGTTNDSYQQCLEWAKFVSLDDCGIEYEEELDPKLAQALCESRDEYPEYFVSGDVGNISLGNYSMELDIDDGPRRLVVWNPDERIQVTTTTFPSTTTMLIIFTDSAGYQERCTGTMISRTWLITAGHCLWSNGVYHANIVVYKNVRSVTDITHRNKYDVDRVIIHNLLMTSNIDAHDMGLLRLTQDPGVSYLGFGYCDTWRGDYGFTNYQFPADKGWELWAQSCLLNANDPSRFTTSSCSTELGASGSSYYRPDPVTGLGKIIYGVHTAGYTNYNGAFRITFGAFCGICSQVEIDEPGYCGTLCLVI